jgi:pyruvate dehydrogenase E1 component beta subunit
MKYAIREDDPVVFLESKESRMRGEIPDENTDQLVKPGKANILKAGSDVTIVGWQWGILKALEAADELADEGIDAEIIDIRTIVPLDTETIVNSCAKTGKLVVISESRRRGGFGNDIIAAVAELGYSELKGVHPMHYVCGKDYPLPFGYGEKYIMPDKDDLIAGVHRVLE